MKTCKDKHLQMANQESNINKVVDKMNLKTFNSKRLKKSCYCFLSSIVTLSILSVANSSFAFPAQLKDNYDGKIDEIDVFTAPRDKKRASYYDEGSLLDILYCRNDKWCYISGYYSLGTNEPVGYRDKRHWVETKYLCDYINTNTNTLEPCNSNEEKDIAIRDSNDNFKLFFCSQKKNPWTWFLPDETCKAKK